MDGARVARRSRRTEDWGRGIVHRTGHTHCSADDRAASSLPALAQDGSGSARRELFELDGGVVETARWKLLRAKSGRQRRPRVGNSRYCTTGSSI